MRSTLVALLTAAAALPFLASCSATVEPDGYGYYDTNPGYYYGPNYYYRDAYPRYHEYHPIYRHDWDDHRREFHEHHREIGEHRGPEIHGRIAIER
ncbi:MAG: hypothetical protein ACTHN5_18250 [Phycisphaerae bacterium]